MFARLKPAWPSPEAVLSGFNRPKFVRLRFERFPRGADNYHIDVALGPVLGKAVASYISALVREHVQHLWKQPVSAYSDSACEGFRRVLVDHHSAVVKQARSASRLERVQLFQLSVLKLLLDQTDAELANVRRELEDARSQPARQLNGQSLQLHRQSVILARHAPHVRYRVTKRLIRELMRLDHGSMRKLRKSVLGLSWPIPENMLTNPVLQLDGLGSVRDFSRIYPMLLHDEADCYRVNRLVLNTLANWLPANVDPNGEQPAPDGTAASPGRGEQGASRGLLDTERRVRRMFSQQEINDSAATWLDLPDNATALLGGTEERWPRPCQWHHPGITGLQRHLSSRFETRLKRAGLMPAVSASYALSAMYPSLGLVDVESLVYEFLKGGIGRREMIRRLRGVEGVSDAAALVRRIEQLRRDYEKDPLSGKRQLMARFIGDFLRLRRDLKLAWRMFVGMDNVRLLNDERELELSLANNSLQVFCREDVAVDTRGSVIGHVIIKVDVRGSEEISTQMRSRNLNPAAHFSRFFYDPITRMLDRFAGNKVVVEGDSVMLSVLEYGGDAAERLAVARACCLAIRILELVDVMNAEHERIGLPRIELGLGVAYADEPPTYLYDHGRKVTISPAIRRARRMSSCHGLMRSTCPLPGDRGLCVVSPVHAEGGGETLVRYNVNGIEIDAAAFAQLHVEISLRRLTMRERGGKLATVLYAGTCSDTQGDSHLLVVRERPVKLWMGKQLLETEEEGRRYYEVVTDPRIVGRVAERLGTAADGVLQTAPGIGQLG